MSKKKMLLIVVIGLVVSSCINASVYATSLGSIPYWEADQSQIGRWNITRNVYHGRVGFDGIPSSDFTSYVSHARTEWSNAGISTSATTSEVSANVRIYNGTFAILSLRNPDITSLMAGYTHRGTMQYEGDWSYLGTPRTGYLYSDVECYVVYVSGLSANHYKHVITHELGHALGWIGHTSGTANVMYHTATYIPVTLTTVDKRHIGQIY